ncbi:MAG TPA: FG-GAP-like repeat-containing protein, partial [Tepidisphaeraceae bacterium]|nr:FG-GAP-like repeat-containing protein [Tepidisphaeraceae bacterium]
MSFAGSNATSRARLQQAARFQVEALERRVLLSSAIAAFNAQQAFPTGTNPLSLAVADVNRDGKLDLIVANNTDGNVGVLLGDGTGSFLNQATFASGPTPIAVAVADVNGDGKPDILVANYGSSSVSVLLGNGDGTFQAPLSFATGNDPIAVTTADVNADGKPDILVANYGSGTVSVLDGNGDGTFQPQQTFAAGAHPISIASADLNVDGKPDIAVSNYTSSTVSVLLGTGGGSFSAAQTFAVGGHPRSVVVSDINGDGKPDLVVVNKADGTTSVLLGNGNGTFATQLTSYVGASPNAVAVADVNGDGKEDLVVADASTAYPGNVAVLLGNRDGTFQPAVNFNTGSSPYALAVADLNGDGRLDIATVNQRDNTVSILLGDVPPRIISINRTDPPGETSDSSVTYTVTFSEPVTGVDPSDFSLALTGVTASTPVSVSGSGSTYRVTVTGISGEGFLRLDFVDNGTVRNAAGNPLQPTGHPVFQPMQTFYNPGVATNVVVSDLNGDGRPDLLTSGNYGYVSELLGNGDGTFKPGQSVASPADRSLTVADFNGDGRPDLLTSGQIFLGNGNGTFQQPIIVNAGPFAADLNGDGKLDLVRLSGNDIGVLLGNGNGTFQPQRTYYNVGVDPQMVAIADVNGDGKPDLVIPDKLRDALSILFGNGDGTFQPPFTISTGRYPTYVSTADINGDGNVDLVVEEYEKLAVFLGNGNGTFREQQTIPSGFSVTTYPVTIADINHDGKPDLIFQDGGLGIALGNGNGTFQTTDLYSGSFFGPSPITVADVNGDGRLDIVGASGGDAISVALASSQDNLMGQTYQIVPYQNTITGTSGNDQIFLFGNPDGIHVDWGLNFGSASGEVSLNDPSGLTINGNGGNDTVYLNYPYGNPLPSILHLNGTFTISGLQGTNPLAGTTFDMGRSTVFISYSSPASDPIAAITGYLQAGYNNGGWNGTPTATTGVITSLPAAANPNHNTGIGYADSADGQGVNTTPNTIELTYTLYGDANLDHQVNSADLQILLAFLNRTGAW